MGKVSTLKQITWDQAEKKTAPREQDFKGGKTKKLIKKERKRSYKEEGLQNLQLYKRSLAYNEKK